MLQQDRYNAIWVSHSSIGDFLKCPRLYFLRNIYKTKDNRKISLASPFLSLGTAVHETLEGLAKYRAEERFHRPLEPIFEENWKNISGKKGGFKSEEEESEAKERARKMILMVAENPGPLAKKTVKIKNGENSALLSFYLSPEENIILCGKIDWLEYIEKDDSLNVIDFKTGRNDEDGKSLQIPIYMMLLNALQKRKISGAAYWYLERQKTPSPVAMPDIQGAKNRVLSFARMIKTAKENNNFKCPKGPGGCFACRPYEKILRGEAEFIGQSLDNKEIYLL
ncbi:MAG: PD-(D/E)XK nuclease family protein [Candidatus Staskawiczbacteria bacterium]|nr:PD-(D/E)XK nuclease family protein [Candidatus Staskawiczbacteria bacterium]